MSTMSAPSNPKLGPSPPLDAKTLNIITRKPTDASDPPYCLIIFGPRRYTAHSEHFTSIEIVRVKDKYEVNWKNSPFAERIYGPSCALMHVLHGTEELTSIEVVKAVERATDGSTEWMPGFVKDLITWGVIDKEGAEVMLRRIKEYSGLA